MTKHEEGYVMQKTIAFAALALLAAGQAQAQCKQADAKGTWITYQAAFIAGGGAEPHVGQCKLVVDKAGSIDNQASFCEFVTFNTPKFPTDGSISVNKDCSATIKLGLGDFNGQVQLTRDKLLFSGRFSAQGGTVSGTTTAVKQ